MERIQSQDIAEAGHVPLDAIMALAGVDKKSPHIARCLLIDPPAELIDLIADWVIERLGKGSIRVSVLAEAFSIRLSAIETVQSRRNQLTLRFVAAEIPMAAAMAIADAWIDFAKRGTIPSRSYQTAVHFGGENTLEELVLLLASGNVRELLCIAEGDWPTAHRFGDLRAEVIEFLTLQVVVPGRTQQLLKFQTTRMRPDRALVIRAPGGDQHRWDELVWWESERRWFGVGETRSAPDMSSWRHAFLPRPFCYPSAPWTLVNRTDAALFCRLDRNYGRLRPEDASVGATSQLDRMWLTHDSDGFDPDETLPVAGLQNLIGSPGFSAHNERIVWTRDRLGQAKPLEELSAELRGWIYDRIERLATSPELSWWANPWADVPAGRFVAIPIDEDHGRPTVFEGGTFVAPGMVWFQPHVLDPECVAALMTAGPLHRLMQALSQTDSTGKATLTLEVLTSLRLPRRIHPLIQEDLIKAYREHDVAEMGRLSHEVYSGNERALLRHRESTGPSLFDQRAPAS